jgi:hypothetical protein
MPKTISVYETQPEGRTETEHATVIKEGSQWKVPFTEYEAVLNRHTAAR